MLYLTHSIINFIFRVPLIITIFIVLWGLCLWVLDKRKIEYGFVLSIRNGNYSKKFGILAYLLANEIIFAFTC